MHLARRTEDMQLTQGPLTCFATRGDGFVPGLPHQPRHYVTLAVNRIMLAEVHFPEPRLQNTARDQENKKVQRPRSAPRLHLPGT